MDRSSPRFRLSLPIALTGALIALLGVLALLQYRWIGQIGAAERDKLEESLQTATDALGEDLYRELARVGLTFGSGSPAGNADPSERLGRNHDFWQATAPFPDLVGDIYTAAVEPQGTISLQRFDPGTGVLEPAGWPAPLDELRSRVEDLGRSPRPVFDLLWRGGVAVEGTDETIWLLLPGEPFAASPPRDRRDVRRVRPQWTLVSIDADYLSSEVLPSIIGSHFDPEEYRVGVFRADRLLYANDPAADAAALDDPDARGAVVMPIPDGRGRARGGRRLTLDGNAWEIRVKYQPGSLDAAVAAVRRRNLAVGFGILALLGVAGALTIVWAQRARSLGRIQMEFAAGMSHELRTPLATIRTAAHNIAAGVVDDPETVKEYAGMVQAEGRRLSSMVDQVIRFAQTESGRRQYAIEPVPPRRIVENALATTFSGNDEAARAVRTMIEPDLPPALADETAATHALVNLLVNALKYGTASGGGPGVEIEASHDPVGRVVRIAVRDHGPGIDGADRARIFEPYYRGADTAHVPGSGLGLSLVRKMMEGQGGRVSVDSRPGQGAAFTLQWPATPRGGAGTE